MPAAKVAPAYIPVLPSDIMSQPNRSRPLVYALYVNAFLLFAILLAVITRGSGTALPLAGAAAIAPNTMAGGNGLYVMPAQLFTNIFGCYVLDTEKQTLCCYSYKDGTLRLIASRSIAWDRQLTNFNTSPDPDEIRKLVQIGQQPLRGIRPQVPAPTQGPGAPEKVEPQADKQLVTPNKEPAP
jgi:hypothetical protein